MRLELEIVCERKRIRPEDMHIMANIFYQVMNSMILNALVTLYLRVQPIYYRFSTIKRACLSRYKW